MPASMTVARRVELPSWSVSWICSRFLTIEMLRRIHRQGQLWGPPRSFGSDAGISMKSLQKTMYLRRFPPRLEHLPFRIAVSDDPAAGEVVPNATSDRQRTDGH